MKRKFNHLLVGGLLAIGANIGIAQSADFSECEQCHGKDGNSTVSKVPSIAGMSEPYIVDTLLAYAEGERPAGRYTPPGGETSDMATVAKSLSETDMEAAAAHFASKTYVPRMQGGDPAMIDKGRALFAKRCDKCHTDGGSLAEDDAGLLLGQGKEYLAGQFDLFASGQRYMSKKMAKSFKKLSDADKAAVIEYLASGNL